MRQVSLNLSDFGGKKLCDSCFKYYENSGKRGFLRPREANESFVECMDLIRACIWKEYRNSVLVLMTNIDFCLEDALVWPAVEEWDTVFSRDTLFR
jgi:hypothetical protein